MLTCTLGSRYSLSKINHQRTTRPRTETLISLSLRRRSSTREAEAADLQFRCFPLVSICNLYRRVYRSNNLLAVYHHTCFGDGGGGGRRTSLRGREKMLEIPATDSSATANIASVKRYAPPNQRNRSLGRRKSGIDRLERANSYSSDGEKNQNSILRNMASLDHHGDAGGNGRTNEKHRPSGSTLNVISLNGCSNSEVVQLLNDRWVATMNMYNTLPEGSPERPVMYTRNAMPWRLPHQMSLGAGVGPSAGVQRDFLREMWQAIHSQDSSSK